MIHELLPVLGLYQSYLLAGYPICQIEALIKNTTYEQST